jgi:hypothetical protein
VRDGCAARSRASAEAAHGTASRARRWILFEHPGAWGAEVLDDATLAPELGTQLRRWASEVPARVLLLRRAPGVAQSLPRRTLLVGVTTPEGGWFERLDLPSPEHLLDVDLSGLAAERSVGGEPVRDPFYLVCTNGKHDACCAELGRPVVDALAARYADRVWECSHVGGDRFAGNLVCFPEGTFYGHLDAGVATTVVAAHEEGRLDLERWRGRSCLPFPSQSAELFARRELGRTHLDDLRWLGSHRDGDRSEVTFAVAGEAELVRVVVRRTAGSPPRTLTCDGVPTAPPVHELLAIERLPPGSTPRPRAG